MPLEIYLNQILLTRFTQGSSSKSIQILCPLAALWHGRRGSYSAWGSSESIGALSMRKRVVGTGARNISCGLGNRQVRLGVFPYNVIELFRGGWNRWTFYGIRDLFKLRSRASKFKLTSQLLYISSSPVQCPGQLRVWPVNTAVAEYPRGGRVHDPR